MESRIPRTRKPIKRLEFEHVKKRRMKRFPAKPKRKYQKKEKAKTPTKKPLPTVDVNRTTSNNNDNNGKIRIPPIAPRPTGEIAINTANSNNSILTLNPPLTINANENRGIIITKNSNGVYQLGFAAPTFEYSNPVGLPMSSTAMQPVLCVTNLLPSPFLTLPQQNSAIQVTPVPTPAPDSNTRPSPGLSIEEGSSSITPSKDTAAIPKSASPDHGAKETVSSSKDPAEISKIKSNIPDDSSADDIMVVNERTQDNSKRKKNSLGDVLIKSRKNYMEKKTKNNVVKRPDTNLSAKETFEFPSSPNNNVNILRKNLNSRGIEISPVEATSSHPDEDSSFSEKKDSSAVGRPQLLSGLHRFAPTSSLRLVSRSDSNDSTDWIQQKRCITGCGQEKSTTVPSIHPTTKNDSHFVYDLQVKVEPPDDTDKYETVCENMFPAKIAETPERRGPDAEMMDDTFTKEDISCPEKAKLYFIKMQKQQVQLNAQEEHQQNALREEQEQKISAQREPPIIKEEVIIASDDEDNNHEKKGQKRKVEPTKFQKYKYRALEDNLSSRVDEIEAYAVTVAAKLRKMSSQQRMFAENIINQALYKGLMNELTASTQAIETQPILSVQSQAVLPKVQQPQLFNVQPSSIISFQQSPRISVEPSPNINVEPSQKTSIQQSDKTSVQQSNKTSVQQSPKTSCQQSPIPSVQQSVSQPVQQAQLQNQQSQLSSIQSLPLTHPLVAMNIQTPQLHNSFQFQNQTLQDTYGAVVPIGTNRSLGPTIYTTHFSDPTIISNVPWKQSGTGGI